MSCTCKKDIESRLLDRFKEQSPEASEHTAYLQGYGIAIVENKMQQLGVMAIELSASFPMKGGTLRKRKKIKQTMFFNYCPFCGVSAKGTA